MSDTLSGWACRVCGAFCAYEGYTVEDHRTLFASGHRYLERIDSVTPDFWPTAECPDCTQATVAPPKFAGVLLQSEQTEIDT